MSKRAGLGILALLPLALLALALLAPAAANSALADPGEPRILRKEVVVNASLDQVWHAWTTNEGVAFASAKSRVELEVGGPYEWFIDGEPAADGARGSEGSRVVAFLSKEMLVFDWTFPPDVPSLRNAGVKTHVVLLFDELGKDRVRVRFAQTGWQQGEDWDKGYEYFDAAWGWVLDQLVAHFEGSPGSR